MKYRTLAVVLFSTSLAGCQTSGQIVPIGKDSYIVVSNVIGCVSCSAAVTGLQTANAFCAKENKFAIMRNTKNSTNQFGYVVGNELVFSCVDEDDPEYQRPNIRADKGLYTLDKVEQ